MTSRAAVLCGLGTALPGRAISNAEISAQLGVDEDWIVSRTGIRQRMVVEPGVSTGTLAVEAGAEALKSAELDRVDAVLVATTTPDYHCPATAPEVAAYLGQPEVAAFDVAAVCSGFVYAVATAAGFLQAGLFDRVLVIGADTFSSILDPDDRTTAPIFGDGAGAVVLRAGDRDEPGAFQAFDLGSDGAQSDLIRIPGGGSKFGRHAGVNPYFEMVGRAVFGQAVQRMAQSSLQVLDRSGWAVDELDHVVAHQANVRILAALAERLRCPPERMVANIDRVGNTSAASIPLAMADALAEGRLQTGDRMLLTAFGGGLSWGSATLSWPDLSAA